jgi:hypothetical protein
MVISVLNDMAVTALASQAQLSRPDVRVLFLDNDRNGDPAPAAPSDAASHEHFLLKKPFTLDIFAAKIRSILDMPASMPML